MAGKATARAAMQDDAAQAAYRQLVQLCLQQLQVRRASYRFTRDFATAKL